jgi:hypothetical protein
MVFLFQEEYKGEAIRALKDDLENRPFNLNVEYRQGTISYATLVDTANNDEDIAKTLIRDGLLMFENRREKKLQKLVRRTLMNFTLTSLQTTTESCTFTSLHTTITFLHLSTYIPQLKALNVPVYIPQLQFYIYQLT